MLNRFRNLAKRLELPQESENLVYRIIDANQNLVEVSTAQYARWRMNNDVTKRAVVGLDTVENVVVRTTFSVMPEDRAYKPFGTSAYELPDYDPRPEFSQRYDSWVEAERGHQQTLSRIRQEAAQAAADAEIAQAFAGTAAEVREAITAQLPDLFSVSRSNDLARVRTPLLMADGNSVELFVTQEGGEFLLTGVDPAVDESRGETSLSEIFEKSGVSVVDGHMTIRVSDPGKLASAILAISQAIVRASFASATE
jgi:hypothetical protein